MPPTSVPTRFFFKGQMTTIRQFLNKSHFPVEKSKLAAT